MTDDRKEDWWLMSGSQTMGPRPELIAEFLVTTTQQILFYQPHRFLEYAKPFLGEEISPAAIAETRARKEENAGVTNEHLTGAKWFELVDESDRKVARLARELDAAEASVAALQTAVKLIGTPDLTEKLHITHGKLVLKKDEFSRAQAELRALSATPPSS